MAKLIREPLVQFLLLGLALFMLFNAVSGARGGAGRRIVVNDATVAEIVQRYQSVWQRAPTAEELQGLIETYVREELLFREGVERGLDRDDPVIRRRVLQKIEVITEESSSRQAPTDAELEAYLAAHADRYGRQTVIGFDQVFFDPVRHAAAIEAHVDSALGRLRAGANPDGIGDSSSLARSDAADVASLASNYGQDFAASLAVLPLGVWSGPVGSGYGIHLVRVNTRTAGRASTLAEVRGAVERDWEHEHRERANADYLSKLRQKYTVVMDVDLESVAKPSSSP